MGRLVLIADDDDLVRSSIALALRDGGLRTAQAHDGDTAVALARAERPHVILLDIAMPGMDGLAALSAIKLEPLLRRTPVLMLTASRRLEDVQRAQALGAAGYLAKPIEADDVRKRVWKALSQIDVWAPEVEWLD